MVTNRTPAELESEGRAVIARIYDDPLWAHARAWLAKQPPDPPADIDTAVCRGWEHGPLFVFAMAGVGLFAMLDHVMHVVTLGKPGTARERMCKAIAAEILSRTGIYENAHLIDDTKGRAS